VQSNNAALKRERENSFCFACVSIDTLKTALLIIIWSTDMPQCDSCHFLDFVPTCLPIGRTYPDCNHIEIILPA